MKIVIPMAGRGTRFGQMKDINKNYAMPKPLIDILGKPMIFWAVSSFYNFLQENERDMNKPLKRSDLIFVCLREHDKFFSIGNTLRKLFSEEIHINLVDEVTRGPAETAMFSEPFVDPAEGLIISDSDHHFDATPLWRVITQKCEEDNFFGILPLIQPEDTDPTWSYVELNEKNEVICIKEKDPQMAKRGNMGVVGAYYFHRAEDFFSEVRLMIQENDMVGDENKKEFYLSQIYQRRIKAGSLVKSAFINKGWLLGTPKFVDKFLKERDIA